jgi:hypothetical protein
MCMCVCVCVCVCPAQEGYHQKLQKNTGVNEDQARSSTTPIMTTGGTQASSTHTDTHRHTDTHTHTHTHTHTYTHTHTRVKHTQQRQSRTKKTQVRSVICHTVAYISVSQADAGREMGGARVAWGCACVHAARGCSYDVCGRWGHATRGVCDQDVCGGCGHSVCGGRPCCIPVWVFPRSRAPGDVK